MRGWFFTFLRAALAGWQPAEVGDFAAMLGRFRSDVTAQWEPVR